MTTCRKQSYCSWPSWGAEGLSVSIIESFVAALHYFHIVQDPSCTLPSFYSPHMKVLLGGARQSQVQPESSGRRLPITASLIKWIKAQLAQDASSFSKCMIWAACCTGFFGFLRCAEFLLPDQPSFDPAHHLTAADVSLIQSASR